MSQQRWVVNSVAFALGVTAKTALNLIAGAADRIEAITEIGVSIDGSQNVLVELCESTQAGAGTPGTAPTIKQTGGFTAADTTQPAQVTAQQGYTAEPTVLTRLKAWRFAGPGPFVVQFPLGKEPQSLLSGSAKYKALALRITAASGTPACDSYIEFE